MARWPRDKEQKRQIRLSIIRHRKNILQHLNKINDTVLRPRIALEPKDIKFYESNVNNQLPRLVVKEKNEEYKNKEDAEEYNSNDKFKEMSESSNDIISIGSHEFSNNDIQILKDSNVEGNDSRRRSKRLKADKHNRLGPTINNKQRDCKYIILLKIDLIFSYTLYK